MGDGQEGPRSRNESGKIVTSWALAFAAGVWLLQQLPRLPDARWILLLPLALPLACGMPRGRWISGLVTGFLWAWCFAPLLPRPLAPDWEGRDLALYGQVVSFPERDERGVHFLLQPLQAGPWGAGARLRLAWYGRPPPLRLGDCLDLVARLHRPREYANPGGFRYEAWAFRRHIVATGYVRSGHPSGQGCPRHGVQRLRAALARQLMPYRDAAGAMMRALAVGDRSGIDAGLRRLLRRTGTSHLVAISGLHVGLLAALLYGLFCQFWLVAGLGGRWPAPRAAALLTLPAVTGYALLAGFGLPTQRALVMLAVGLAGVWSLRGRDPARALGLALVAVLLFDPLAVTGLDFLLSFGAVGLIFYLSAGRLGRAAAGLVARTKASLRLALAMALLIAAVLGQFSWIAPLCNLVAVPLVALAAVPLLLLGLVAGWLGLPGADLCLGLVHGLLDGLLRLLHVAARLPLASIHWPMTPWQGIWLLAGTLLLWLPRALPGRLAGMLILVASLALPPSRPVWGTARLWVLDVGQGEAVAVRTRHHCLLFDSGPGFGGGRNAGAAIIRPFLLARGIARVDALVVSHGDDDHAGGAASLLRLVPVDRLWVPGPLRLPGPRPGLCRRGAGWQWDGVRFRFLHPESGRQLHGNQGSCVLLVATQAGTRALLPGDIGRQTERWLADRLGPRLRADVLVAPHHGSAGSSSWPFLKRVQPRWILISAGHHNRFRFPRPAVLARYRALGIPWRVTGEAGALEVDLARPPAGPVHGWRRRRQRYWQLR